ncbi:MAG: AI-2E family transporter [Bacteroidales bacterium]|nr:AI-2E family transporter [Bacteroidales bacterium]
MNRYLKPVGTLLLIILIGFLAWKFSFLIVYILIAAVVSFIGHPIVRFLDKVRIFKVKIPHTLSVILTLCLLIIGFLSLFAIFVPLIVQQAQTFAMIDMNQVASHLQQPLSWIEDELRLFGVLASGDTLENYLATKARSVINVTDITGILNQIFGFAGSFFVGLFSVVFIAFFFLKEERMFENMIFAIVPEKNHEAVQNVIDNSKQLLMRYFVGLLTELLGVMSIITIGLWIFGVKNALLLGFFGGLMNIIPYLGPVIGTLLGLVLGASSTLASADYAGLTPVLLKIGSVFLVANYIDNLLLQPMIYSSSVKAHPLEIFFVIIIGGSLAGITGMLLAIPVYTVLRVIAKEFFSKFRLVKKLTEDI